PDSGTKRLQAIGIRCSGKPSTLLQLAKLTLRSTFSSFPDGAPGFGLVLLRAIAGTALVFCGSLCFTASEARALGLTLATLSIFCGLSLLLGLFNSIVCSLTALISVGIAFSLIAAPTVNVTSIKISAVFTAVIAVALLCLGPGAYSLDARRHGRREI